MLKHGVYSVRLNSKYSQYNACTSLIYPEREVFPTKYNIL